MIDIMRPSGCLRDGLCDLIKELPAGITMVEIGCFSGESTLMFAESPKINKIYCVDLWTNGADTTDLTTTQYDLVEVEKAFDFRMAEYIRSGKAVKIKGDSLESAQYFTDETIDFIYIDGCHEYSHVSKELWLYWPKVKPGGLIGGHDYNSCYGGINKAVDEFFFNGPDKLFCDFSWLKYKGE